MKNFPSTPYFYCTMKRPKLDKRSESKRVLPQYVQNKVAPAAEESSQRAYTPSITEQPITRRIVPQAQAVPKSDSYRSQSVDERARSSERRDSSPRRDTDLQNKPKQVDRGQSPGVCGVADNPRCGDRSKSRKRSSDNGDDSQKKRGSRKSSRKSDKRRKSSAISLEQSESSNEDDVKKKKDKRHCLQNKCSRKCRKPCNTSLYSNSETDSGKSSSSASVVETETEVKKFDLGAEPPKRTAESDKTETPPQSTPEGDKTEPPPSLEFSPNIAKIILPEKSDPLPLMQEWLDTARMRCHYIYANCMNVATITKEGRPSNRYILMREFKDGCYYFLTAKSSRKYEELQINKYIGISFLWVFIDDENRTICRQVRIEGVVEEMNHAYTKTLFDRLPRIEKFRNQFCIQGREVTWEDFEFRHDSLLTKVKDNMEIIEDMPDNLVTFKVTPNSFEFFNVIGDGYYLPDRVWYSQKEDGSWVHTNVET